MGAAPHFAARATTIWAIVVLLILGFVLYAILFRAKIDVVQIRKSRKDYRSPFRRSLTGHSDEVALAARKLPVLRNLGDVAALLGVSTKELEWLSTADFNHYRSFVLEKSNGALRLIDAPKVKLKAVQRTIYEKLLRDRPLHAAVSGFRPGRNTRHHAAPHARKQTVLSMDLQDFFPGISARRVCGLLKSWGYSEEIALLFTCLTTYNAHLPQGAPTSPALANLIFTHADVRLAGLARRFEADYSRYADDITFSGGLDFQRTVGAFSKAVKQIVADEGFRINHNKTRLMRQGRRQVVTGLVVNERPNVPRRHRRQLRAILHNAVRRGFESQNRFKHPNFAEHLRGKIAYVSPIHPALGQRLLADWKQTAERGQR